MGDVDGDIFNRCNSGSADRAQMRNEDEIDNDGYDNDAGKGVTDCEEMMVVRSIMMILR